MQKSRRYDIGACIALYAVAGIFIYGTFSIRDFDSRIVPYFLCGFTIVLATIYLIKALTGHLKDEYDFNRQGVALGYMAIMAITTAASYFLGFYLSGFVYMIAGMKYLGYKNKKIMILLPVCLIGFIWLIFGTLFGMPVQVGLLWENLLY